MKDLIRRIKENTTGIFKRDPELIAVVPSVIARIIHSNNIYISEFVIAKIQGKIKNHKGHSKITDDVLLRLPHSLCYPYQILEDVRKKNRKEYLFINIDPLHQIVVEVERMPGGITEINTVFDTTSEELKRLEGKLPTVFSSGETPISRMHASR